MEIITFATHNSGYYDSLRESAEKKGFSIKVLGYGEKWKGHMDKFYRVKEYIRQQSDDKICVFLDGFDTVVLRKEKECLDIFRSIHKQGKVLVSASSATQIITHLLFGGVHPKDQKRTYNALNTGMYMGYAKDLKKLFDVLGPYLKNPNENDQQMTTHCYLENKCEPYLQLDTNSQIFYNLEWDENPCKSYFRVFMDEGEYKAPPDTPDYMMTGNDDKPIYVKKTRTYPCFLQANMNANMDEMMKKLGHEKKKQNADYDSYSTSTYRQHFKKIVIAVSVFFFHLFIYYITIVHGLISWNLRDLLFILWLQIGILVQWYVIGGCFLSDYEKYLHSEKINSTGGTLSAAAFFCQEYLNIKTEHYDIFITYYPIFYCTVICIKIYYLCSRCKGKNNKK